jgi:hypothetical protein
VGCPRGSLQWKRVLWGWKQPPPFLPLWREPSPRHRKEQMTSTRARAKATSPWMTIAVSSPRTPPTGFGTVMSSTFAVFQVGASEINR